MKNHSQNIFLTIFLATLIFSSVLIFKSTPTVSLDSSITEENIIATDVPRNIRVAVYDESNTTWPNYAAGSPGLLHNNATGMKAILELSGYDVSLISTQNISEHQLITANYDIFVMVDNLPRENVTNLIWDFWAGGGGILSLDLSGIFLCHIGILPPEGAGTTGNGIYWINANEDIIINTRHPVSQSYPNPTTILTSTPYITWDWVSLNASSIGDNLERVAYSTYHYNGISVLTYDPDSGGNVVSISLDLVTDQLPETYSLFQDAADWLCPRPKARIAFDFSHMPRLGVDDHDMYTLHPGEYSELRNSSVARGYTFDKLYPTTDGNITYDRLFNGGYAGYDLLIICLPDYPYLAEEIAVIDQWVSEGNSILIFAESGQNPLFTDAVTQVNNILENMDCQVRMDIQWASTNSLPPEPHLTAELTSSISVGVRGVVNVTGPDAYGLVKIEPEIFIAASEYGKGRVIVSADMNWAADNYIATADNAQFLTNVINWLTSANVNILLYVDHFNNSDLLNLYRTPVVDALNELGHQFYLTTIPTYLDMSLTDYDWDLVIVDNVEFDLGDTALLYDELLLYVESGGRLLMSSFNVDEDSSHSLWGALGFEFVADAPDKDHLDVWNAYHSIYNIPHIWTVGHFSPYYDYGDEGDMLDVTTGTALGGWYVIPTAGNTSIVLGESGRTLYNAYLIDQFTGDEDDSTYSDNFELWENEIAFMMRPLLTHPPDVYMIEGDDEVVNWLWDPPAQLYGAPLYSYEFRLNGSVEDSGFLGGAIVGGWVQRLASLDPGLYIYDLQITGRFGFSANDTVIVHVAEEITTTTTTTTTSTTTTTTTSTTSTTTTTITITGPSGLADIYVVGLVIGGAAIIVALVAIFFKFKPVPANLGHALEKIRNV